MSDYRADLSGLVRPYWCGAGIMLGAMSGDGKGGGARRPRAVSQPRVPPGPLADLKALLYEMYLAAGTPTLDQVAGWVAADEHEDLAGAPGRDTIARIIGDPGMPPSQADVIAVAAVLARAARWEPGDAAARARDLWVAARMAAVQAPATGVRVSEADPRRLGVHAAISVPGVPEEIPPEYVLRDADGAEFGVRAKVASAAERGGFVLLVGGSSVGKTRSAFEAVKALLPDWWLVHPAGPAEVSALAQAPSPRTVVWLDELQRYLDGDHELTGSVVRALLNAPDPVVIIATLWPDRYAAYATLPTTGGTDLYARERQILDLATVVRISPTFSAAEQDRARTAAVRDARLQVALDAAEYGLTQTLAAAPQLVARWEDAQTASPYGWAVLTAALDAARLGARAPLSADFLRDAAPGYCTSAQQAEAPGNWFEQALAYATGKLHGAAAALSPAGVAMGQIAGYTPADYLIQHANRERRYTCVPASTWDAILSYIRDPADTARLAESAGSRLLYRFAIPLYRQAADLGEESAALGLADLLVERGDIDEAMQILLARADAGDGHAAIRLAKLLAKRGELDEAEQMLRAQIGPNRWEADAELAQLLAKRGDLEGLRFQADVGEKFAAIELAKLLAERGDLDGLRVRVYAGDGEAARVLARVLVEHGDLDGAEQIRRLRADAGDGLAALDLADMLAERGDLNGAKRTLRAQADAGNGFAVVWLARLLARHGELDEAEHILRPRDDTADWAAAMGQTELFVEIGDLDGLRAQADAGDGFAGVRLAGLLADRGDVDGLRTRVDDDDWGAAKSLAHLLAERGDVDALRVQVGAGNKVATSLLVHLLMKQGRNEEAERLRQFGLDLDGSIACG